MDLTTSRLHLRRWQHEDAERVLDLYGRLQVMRWLGDGPPRMMENLDQAHAAVDRWAKRSSAPPLGYWAVEVRETGVVAGTLLLAALPTAQGHGEPAEPETEIAWHLHPDSWGHGYATEAAERLLRYGFEGDLDQVWALTHAGNTPSQRVCERLGLRHVGQEQPWYDVAMEVYRLTAEEHAGR